MTENSETLLSKKGMILALIGIFALYFTQCAFGIITPAINSLAVHFEGTPLTTILLANTITGVVSIPVSILVGMWVKWGYRKWAILGLVIATLGGAFPFFMGDVTSYEPVIASRVLVGIGLGMVNPLAGALVIELFTGKKRALYLGIGNLVFFGGGMIYQMLSGGLANIGWNYHFLAYFLTVIPFILVAVFLPEPAKLRAKKGVAVQDAKKEEPKVDASAPKPPLPASVFGYVAIAFVVIMFDMPAVFLCSTMLAEGGMGDAGVAGVVSSLFTGGGMIAGAIFAVVYAATKRKVFAVFTLCSAVSMFIIFNATSAIVFGLGMILLGIGHIGVFTAAQEAGGKASPAVRVGVTNGMMMAAMNLGVFFASYYMEFAAVTFPQMGIGAPVLVSGVLLLVCAVLFFFVPGCIKPKQLPAASASGSSENSEV